MWSVYMELDSVSKVGPNVFELEILPKSKGLKNGRTSLKTMPREPQKEKWGGSYKVPKTKT
jgi:hypothetical protein